MTVLVFLVPAHSGNLKSKLDKVLDNLTRSTFENIQLKTKEYWSHAKYDGRVYFESDGHVCKIEARDADSEAFTLGAFLNWVYRNAQDEIHMATIVFPQSVES
jgi:hypothetical protein